MEWSLNAFRIWMIWISHSTYTLASWFVHRMGKEKKEGSEMGRRGAEVCDTWDWIYVQRFRSTYLVFSCLVKIQ